MAKIIVQNTEVSLMKVNRENFICLSDMIDTVANRHTQKGFHLLGNNNDIEQSISMFYLISYLLILADFYLSL